MKSETSLNRLSLCFPLLLMTLPFSRAYAFEVLTLGGALLVLASNFKNREPIRLWEPSERSALILLIAFSSVCNSMILGGLRELGQQLIYFIFFPLLMNRFIEVTPNALNSLRRAMLFYGMIVVLFHFSVMLSSSEPFSQFTLYSSSSHLGLCLSFLIPFFFVNASWKTMSGLLFSILCLLATTISTSACSIGICISLCWITITRFRKSAILFGLILLLQTVLFIRQPVNMNPLRHVLNDLTPVEMIEGSKVPRQRFIEARAALRMIADHAMLGVGPGNYQAMIGKYYGFLPKNNTMKRDTQSGWLVLGSSCGVLTVGILFMMYLKMILLAPRTDTAHSDYFDVTRDWRQTISAAGLALAINSLFSYPLVAGITPLIAVGLVLHQKYSAGSRITRRSRRYEIAAGFDFMFRRNRFLTALAGCVLVYTSISGINEHELRSIIILPHQLNHIEHPMRLIGNEDAAYLEIPMNSGKGWRDGTGGRASFPFRIDSPGLYTVWADTWWHDPCSNGFDVSISGIKGQPPRKYILGNDATFQKWHWSRGPTCNLDVGNYELTISNREDGVKLRALLITNDRLFDEDRISQKIHPAFEPFFSKISHWNMETFAADGIMPRGKWIDLYPDGADWSDYLFKASGVWSTDSIVKVTDAGSSSSLQFMQREAQLLISIDGHDAGILPRFGESLPTTFSLQFKRVRDRINGEWNGAGFSLQHRHDNPGKKTIAVFGNKDMKINQIDMHGIRTFFDGFAGCDMNLAAEWQLKNGDWRVVDASRLGTMGIDNALLQVSKNRAEARIGNRKWRGYSASIDVFPTCTGGWGLGFGADSTGNFYLVRAADTESSLPYNGRIQLVRGDAKEEMVLAERSWSGSLDEWHSISVSYDNASINICLDDISIAANSVQASGEGSLFLFSDACPGIYFDNFLVEFHLPE